MADQAAPRSDPRAGLGPFHDLMKEIRLCKEAGRCPDLTSRSYYFEPNPATVLEWQAAAVYSKPVNPHVVFVCESPGPRFASENEAAPLRCWAEGESWRDRRFLEARKKWGLADCYITNTVKCGGIRRRHTEQELRRCRDFLVRELEFLQPLVAVAVGRNAYRTLRREVLHRLDSPPIIFEVTHYSARRDVRSRWEREFAALKRLLARLRPR